jgi:AcrR family transcriptional regulator
VADANDVNDFRRRQCGAVSGVLGIAGESHVANKLNARQKILDTVADLFYREGIRAVGVDRVVAEAGIAKMTLYHYFPTKDHLVVGFLEESDERYWEWWDRVMALHPESPREQLQDLFDALVRRVTRSTYRGCPFINTSTEFPTPDHPARAVILRHKRELWRRLQHLATSAGSPDSDGLADQLVLLIDGAYASAQTLGAEGPAARVAQAARGLLQRALGE